MDPYYPHNPKNELDASRKAASNTGSGFAAQLPVRKLVNSNIPPISNLVTKKEKFYGTISLLIGIGTYSASLLMIFGFFLAPILLLTTFITHGLFLGG